jgi:hypothetical protein
MDSSILFTIASHQKRRPSSKVVDLQGLHGRIMI